MNRFNADWRNYSATRWVTTIYGILVGAAGIEHGIFEVLQGNIPTEGIMIDAIGPDYRFWPGAGERALTLIPNYLFTGIVAIVVGLLAVIWSIGYVERKYGASILTILLLTLFLVGGGFAPIFMSLFACLAATRVNQPLNWWRSHFPGKNLLAKLWPWILIFYTIVFVLDIGIQIFGIPLDVDTTTALVWNLAYMMLALMPVVVIVGFTKDVAESSANQKDVQ